MKRSKTTYPPFFSGQGDRLRSWDWTVLMQVGSSGYIRYISVVARRRTPDHWEGRAEAVIPPFFDPHECIEALAVEAMLAAAEPTLFGEMPTRVCDIAAILA